MPRSTPDPDRSLTEVTFRCATCAGSFKAAPGRVEDAPDEEHHPYRYFAVCPECGADCPQVGWERGLIKAWAKSTGPKTDEGKARSAANLKGHPTPEESRRIRFNALKHGLYMKQSEYFPARPGKYAFCASCTVDRGYCARQPACVKQTEVFMLHHAAFDQKNPALLTDMYGSLQASIYSLLSQMVQTVIADGVKIERPCFDFDKEGGFHLAEFVDDDGTKRRIMDLSAHPLLKPISDFLSKNNLSLSDMGMTMKMVEEEPTLPGQLQHAAGSGVNADDWRERQLVALEALRGQVDRANRNTEDDAVYQAFKREQGGDVIDVDAKDV